MVPKRSTWVPPALVETSPPIVAEPRAPSVSGKRRPAASAASCRCARITPASQTARSAAGSSERIRFIRRSDRIRASPDRVGGRPADHRGVAALRHQRHPRLGAEPDDLRHLLARRRRQQRRRLAVIAAAPVAEPAGHRLRLGGEALRPEAGRELVEQRLGRIRHRPADRPDAAGGQLIACSTAGVNSGSRWSAEDDPDGPQPPCCCSWSGAPGHARGQGAAGHPHRPPSPDHHPGAERSAAGDRPAGASLIKWRESRGPNCIAATRLIGATLLSQNSVDLILRDNSRVRARLQRTCPSLDYYRGFYINATADGRICADRDSIRSRAGGECRSTISALCPPTGPRPIQPETGKVEGPSLLTRPAASHNGLGEAARSR